MVLDCGSVCRRIPSLFASRTFVSIVIPVIVPPGWLKRFPLAELNGITTDKKNERDGLGYRLCRRDSRASPPVAAMITGLRAINSAVRDGNRS